MSEERTHWRALMPSDYIGAWDIPEGKDLKVKILSVEEGEVTGVGGMKDIRPIVELEGQNPWVLNVTNGKMITKVLGSPRVQDWIGKEVTLYSTLIEDKKTKEMIECIRVRETAPALPELVPTDKKKWDAAVKALKDKSFTIEQIETKYKISAANKKRLLDK